MLIRRRRGWEIPESETTPEAVYLNRRHFMRAAGVGAVGMASILKGIAPAFADSDPSLGLYPARHDALFTLDRPLTAEKDATSYNNFYEFGTDKNIVEAARALRPRPWTITIDGLVAKPLTLDIDDLLRQVTLEERLYRHRCVETWAMAVPWTGFPLKKLLDLVQPLSSAKYVEFETFMNPDIAPGQSQLITASWPYLEGLTVAEAQNDLAFVVTGIYGKPLPPQNGTPIRLVVPWKYGFKSIKSIVHIKLTTDQPLTYWQDTQPEEYGFWANVNPEVPHPRWSQAYERMLGTDEIRRTQIWNGYGSFVADMYKGLESERLFV